ncbi:hypothetical protein [Candidatus Enterovibrio escicola]|uniref:hypothetical protein n=1 Tax=Candidatus Enterovibrio escicola TaxID=1927127 RepID=UPI000BE3C1B2|nr:hypothetical protein [Candidatus Enterovibrio escacola]
MNVLLKYLTYTCISKRSKTIKVKYHLPSFGVVVHLVIDTTDLKYIAKVNGKCVSTVRRSYVFSVNFILLLMCLLMRLLL